MCSGCDAAGTDRSDSGWRRGAGLGGDDDRARPVTKDGTDAEPVYGVVDGPGDGTGDGML